MLRGLIVAPLSALLLAAAPSPAPSPQSLSIVCQHTAMWLFPANDSRAVRAAVPAALLGDRFALVSGPRASLEGDQYYETDVLAIEPGYRGQHYWVARACAIPIA